MYRFRSVCRDVGRPVKVAKRNPVAISFLINKEEQGNRVLYMGMMFSFINSLPVFWFQN
jgi:hypothetical protein